MQDAAGDQLLNVLTGNEEWIDLNQRRWPVTPSTVLGIQIAADIFRLRIGEAASKLLVITNDLIAKAKCIHLDALLRLELWDISPLYLRCILTA